MRSRTDLATPMAFASEKEIRGDLAYGFAVFGNIRYSSALVLEVQLAIC